MAKETLIYEFEEQFRNVEGIKLIVRRPRNDKVAGPYDYRKKLSSASTVFKLRERIEKILGHSDYDLLDDNMNTLHGLTKLTTARERQKHTLPSGL